MAHNLESEKAAASRFYEAVGRKKTKKQHKRAYYRQFHPGKYKRAQWEDAHIDAILAPGRLCDKDLAKTILHSISAIQTKRSRCLKLKAEGKWFYDTDER